MQNRESGSLTFCRPDAGRSVHQIEVTDNFIGFMTRSLIARSAAQLLREAQARVLRQKGQTFTRPVTGLVARVGRWCRRRLPKKIKKELASFDRFSYC
jgi:hypothetical protein